MIEDEFLPLPHCEGFINTALTTSELGCSWQNQFPSFPLILPPELHAQPRIEDLCSGVRPKWVQYKLLHVLVV